ncbi:MAG TPA: SAM-dependent chlorinase/fluorinase [Verrucomicrobiales bacterium]|nr:SAM-dependent chlorinase/fluorinase [Verrucomicrobiales bacterium]
MIALLTDFGLRDTYVAELKAVLLTAAPGVPLVDITHCVEPFDVAQGAFLLAQAAAAFPAGAIFLAIVDPGVGTERRPVAFRSGAQRVYVGPDNGLFQRVVRREGAIEAVELPSLPHRYAGGSSATFHGRDIFAPVAAALWNGTALADAGLPIDPATLSAEPPAGPGQGRCAVLHVDSFGNAITSLVPETVPCEPGTKIVLETPESRHLLPVIRTYAQGPEGRPSLLINSAGHLEICCNRGSAAALLGLRPGMALRLRLDQ